MPSINIPTSFQSRPNPAAVVTRPNVRFTMLSSRLIRVEYSATGRMGNSYDLYFFGYGHD